MAITKFEFSAQNAVQYSEQYYKAYANYLEESNECYRTMLGAICIANGGEISILKRDIDSISKRDMLTVVEDQRNRCWVVRLERAK